MQGMKVGVMRQTLDMSTADPGVMQLFQQALLDLASAGLAPYLAFYTSVILC